MSGGKWERDECSINHVCVNSGSRACPVIESVELASACKPAILERRMALLPSSGARLSRHYVLEGQGWLSSGQRRLVVTPVITATVAAHETKVSARVATHEGQRAKANFNARRCRKGRSHGSRELLDRHVRMKRESIVDANTTRSAGGRESRVERAEASPLEQERDDGSAHLVESCGSPALCVDPPAWRINGTLTRDDRTFHDVR